MDGRASSSSSSWSLGASLQCWQLAAVAVAAAQGRGEAAADRRRLPELVPTLLDCAAHVEEGSIEKASSCLARVTRLAAGAEQGPARRLAVEMNGFLARRLLRPIPAIADAIMDSSGCPDRRSVMAARRGFFDLTPFPKVAAAVGNRAILEAMENERNVHVIAFSGVASQPHQWVQLLRDFRRRPGPEGPPHLRLTVVLDDDGALADMSELLSDEAEVLDMAFQFHGVAAQIEALDPNNLHDALHIKSGEARAICCALQLHRLLAVDDAGCNPGAAQFNQMASIARLQQMATGASSSVHCDDDVDPYRSPGTPLSFVSPPASTPHFQMPPPLVGFLAAARALSPKVVVVAEQEANHNGVSFRKRFAEALHHYASLYDALDAGAAALRRPAADERALVERVVLREELRDVLLREGVRRRERHDGLHQWALRMELAGFRRVPLSYIAIKQGNDVLRACGWRRHCVNHELHGCLLLCWSSRPLYSVSVWRPSRWPEG